jgi:arsenite methyltransferase
VVTSMRRGDYGFDAPYVLAAFAALSVASTVAALVAWAMHGEHLARVMTAYAAFFSVTTACFLHTTRRGKFVEWARILDDLPLRGDERVLDMGCGRGAVLTAVARRLSTGRVTGIDLWTSDQSGNARDVTLRNATIEGVADRVDVETGDMRALPYHDAAFGLVVSSMAIHNISGSAERRRAVAEGFRVLAPGGRFVIADIRATSSYADALRELGASDVRRRRLGWRFWWGTPFAATTLVTASKPLA